MTKLSGNVATPIAEIVGRIQGGGQRMTTSPASRLNNPPKNDEVFFNRLLKAGVGLRNSEFVMHQFTTPEIRDTESKWWDQFQSEKSRLGTCMLDVLLGPRGRGKTTLACMLVGCSCWKGQRPAYTTAADMSRQIRLGFDDHTDNQSRFETADLLVIDEYNRVAETEWADITTQEIIDKRYLWLRDTLLITNHTKDAFLRGCNTSIRSRITQCGKILILDGEDFRTGGGK
jgi:hypothetical protein